MAADYIASTVKEMGSLIPVETVWVLALLFQRRAGRQPHRAWSRASPDFDRIEKLFRSEC